MLSSSRQETWILSRAQVREVKLLCKQHLRGFYAAAGFTDMGLSDVVHGQDPWHEMALEVESGDLHSGPSACAWKSGD